MGIPDDRLKLRVTIDSKFKESVRRSQAVAVCSSQLTPPAKVPSSPTCSSPDQGDQDSLYESQGYSKQQLGHQFAARGVPGPGGRVPSWGTNYQGYQLPEYHNTEYQSPYQRFYQNRHNHNNPYCDNNQVRQQH